MSQIQGKARVGRKELVALFTIFTSAHIFLNYPIYVSRNGMEAAWMCPLLGGVFAIAIFYVIDWLVGRYYPGMDIIEIVKTRFGSFAAILVSLAIGSYFIAITATVMREFVENVITTVLPNTPVLVIGVLFVLTVSYIASLGLEAIARAAFIIMPVFVLGILILCALTANWWHPEFLLPVWGRGSLSVLNAGFHTTSIFTSILLLCVIYPHAKKHEALRSVGIRTVLWSSLILAVFMAVYIMVFPASEVRENAFPLYQLARMIYLGRFIQRLESVFIFLWVTAAIVKMAITIWAASYVLGSAFRWPSFRPSIPAFALLCLTFAMLPQNLSQVEAFYNEWLMPWGWIPNLLVPLTIVVISAVWHTSRNKGGARARRA